jgi:hypothetical protein
MQTSKPRPQLSRLLIYAVALTVGALAALAMQIWLIHAGFEPSASWSEIFSTKARLRTAGPWWATAGAAFIAAGLCASALSRRPPPWRRFRLLRWVAAALGVFALAHVGHLANGQTGGSAALHVAASLAALAVAALLALLGAYFTVRR